jgi:hypothetical protein
VYYQTGAGDDNVETEVDDDVPEIGHLALDDGGNNDSEDNTTTSKYSVHEIDTEAAVEDDSPGVPFVNDGSSDEIRGVVEGSDGGDQSQIPDIDSIEGTPSTRDENFNNTFTTDKADHDRYGPERIGEGEIGINTSSIQEQELPMLAEQGTIPALDNEDGDSNNAYQGSVDASDHTGTNTYSQSIVDGVACWLQRLTQADPEIFRTQRRLAKTKGILMSATDKLSGENRIIVTDNLTTASIGFKRDRLEVGLVNPCIEAYEVDSSSALNPITQGVGEDCMYCKTSLDATLDASQDLD